MKKQMFWSRLGLYVLFGGILPFAFLTYRFNLFGKVTQMSVNGWTLFAIIFIACFFVKFVKAVKKGLPFSLTTQILEGLCKIVIPLIASAFCVYLMKDLMVQLFQVLCVLILCETIAIVVNPLPQWAHENKIEEDENRTKVLLQSLGITKKDEKK